MPGIQVTIEHYAAEPQPRWIECTLCDAAGRVHTFREKAPVVTRENLDVTTVLPRPGVLACRVVDEHAASGGQDVVVVDTEHPWGIESMTGETRFEVLRTQLVELGDEAG